MPAAVKKQRISMDVFTSFVLPGLQKEHAGDNAALQKAITDKYTVFKTNEDGSERDTIINVKQLATGENDDEDDKSDATDPTAIEQMVEAMVTKAAKNVVGRGAHDIKMRDRSDDDPTGGFKTFSEYSRAVKNYVLAGAGSSDEGVQKLRRIKAPTNYANEGVGADGGFLVPMDYGKTLLSYAQSEQSLLPLTRQLVVSGNTITLPVDNSLPWSTTGVQASWTAEAGVKPDSKPIFDEVTETLHKLTVLVPVTDELLQDSFISLGQYIGETAGQRINSKLNTAIIKGTGAGQPLGYRTSGALKTVAAESAQTATTVNVLNLAKMYAAMPTGSLSNAVWLYNPAVFPQLVTAVIGTHPVWTLNGIGVGPTGSLFGRPLIPVQDMSVLGTVGDIDFVDLKQYVTITKGTGIEQAISIHLYFDRDITTFRFVLRVGGRPWMSTPYTGKDTVNTYSPFVTLASR